MLFAVLLDTTYHDILGRFKIHNCGVSIFELPAQATPRVVLLDDVAHLR
jgi:hypothetical protein